MRDQKTRAILGRRDEFSPEEQRDPHGEWASGGAAPESSKKFTVPESRGDVDPSTVVAAQREAEYLANHGGKTRGGVCDASGAQSAEEVAALSDWTGDDFVPIGKYLRGSGELSEREQDGVADVVGRMDAAVAKQGLAQDTTLYRGLRSAHGNSLVPGAVIRDRSFVSTSNNPKIADVFSSGREPTVMEIHAPKGARALDLTRGWQSGNEEGEVLLPRDSRFRVDSVETRKSLGSSPRDVKYVRVTLLPQEEENYG